MARLQRIAPKDIPIHIIQRGNNRQVCFGSDANHAAFAEWLKEYSQKYQGLIITSTSLYSSFQNLKIPFELQ
jgi:REP element-mobilizing transposase RayT